jgi:hypothetical protein
MVPGASQQYDQMQRDKSAAQGPEATRRMSG